MKVTKHAKKRIRERTGVNKKAVERMAQIAYEKGYTRKQAKGYLAKWMDSVYLKQNKGNEMRIYGDKLYLFDSGLLITVLQIPSNLHNNMKDYIKAKQD